MIAIVDCNSFYCACEKLFKPHLHGKPVVVLSNNDGCIVSRTDEAKALGVAMAGPYFIAKPIIEQHGVSVFSSNYNLYGNLSQRVMDTLRHICGTSNVEVYSVDEAFINLTHHPASQLQQLGAHIKHTVELWTGIPVSVGIAPTKVLSKVANRLAKKNKQKTKGVVVLHTPELVATALQHTPIADVWGVGRQYAHKLTNTFHLHTAYELSHMSLAFAHKYLGGVVGTRLLTELQGTPCIPMKEPFTTKKMIATTRMFGRSVSTLAQIKEAVATYAARAAEKLRRQYSAAQTLQVFLVAKQPAGDTFNHRYGHVGSYTTLEHATSNTATFIKEAVQLATQLYQPGLQYKKAGVILSSIVPDAAIQGNLFATPAQRNHRVLMQAIDNINYSQHGDILKFATTGTQRNWKMRQELRSPCYTTRWADIPVIS